jgi:MFS family permease
MLTVGVLLQAGLGFTPLHASLTMAPWSVGTFAAFGIAMALADRLGRKVVQLGMVLIGLGLGVLYCTFQVEGSALGHWHLVVPQLICGLGTGMVFAMLFDTVLGGVEDHEVGTSSSALESIQQRGVSLGVAALGTLFFGLMGSQVFANFDGDVRVRLRTELAAASITGPAQDQLVAGFRQCVHDRESQIDPDDVPASCRSDVGAPPAAVAGRCPTPVGKRTREA